MAGRPYANYGSGFGRVSQKYFSSISGSRKQPVMNTETPRIGVFGLGNVLMSDDAFGPYSIETLKSLYTFPEHVSVRDLGTPSLELVTYIDELDFLIVLDAVHSDGKPGEIRTY